jgi:hypothetical protein
MNVSPREDRFEWLVCTSVESYFSLAGTSPAVRRNIQVISDGLERENAGMQITVAIEIISEKLGVPLSGQQSVAS